MKQKWMGGLVRLLVGMVFLLSGCAFENEISSVDSVKPNSSNDRRDLVQKKISLEIRWITEEIERPIVREASYEDASGIWSVKNPVTLEERVPGYVQVKLIPNRKEQHKYQKYLVILL